MDLGVEEFMNKGIYDGGQKYDNRLLKLHIFTISVTRIQQNKCMFSINI